MKRFFDIAASVVMLTVLAPLFVLVALAVLVALGRPVLFEQERPGLHGMPFKLMKFRTMRPAADLSAQELSDADRLTSFGRALRASSLDELPQLFNILRGDMSMVGPRPLLVEYLPMYSARQQRRHEVRPGVTGWAQVNGRNALDWDKRLELDVWYVENRTFRLDCKILLMTVWAVLCARGITESGQVSMSKFQGNTPEANQMQRRAGP